MTFDLSFSLTPRDLAAYQQTAQRRLSKAASKAMGWRGEAINVSVAIVFAAAALLANEGLLRWTGHGLDIGPAIAGLIAGAAMMWLALYHRAYEAGKYLTRSDNWAFEPQRLTVDESQLRFSRPLSESVLKWPFITELTECSHHLVLWIEPSAGYIIPRSAFADEAAAKAFCDFAREKIRTSQTTT